MLTAVSNVIDVLYFAKQTELMHYFVPNPIEINIPCVICVIVFLRMHPLLCFLRGKLEEVGDEEERRAHEKDRG